MMEFGKLGSEAEEAFGINIIGLFFFFLYLYNHHVFAYALLWRCRMRAF